MAPFEDFSRVAAAAAAQDPSEAQMRSDDDKKVCASGVYGFRL